MNAMRRWLGVVVMAGVVLGAPLPARALDVVLYEVTEAVRLGKGGSFKSSKATLAGVALPGTVLCPLWLATQLNIEQCTVTVNATGRAGDDTGIGPVSGSFDVLMQDANNVDNPEIVIMRGHLDGMLDLSPAFVDKKPRGTVTGDFSASGVAGTVMAGHRARGRFDGVFRLPFRSGGKPSYQLDDGSIVPVEPFEFMLGGAMVRIEITFTEESASSRKNSKRD
jgi:hypothetical protein